MNAVLDKLSAAKRPLSEVADVLTGVHLRRHPSNQTRYVQIRDLHSDDADLSLGAAPRVKRASPIRAGDILMAARGERPQVMVANPGMYGAYPSLDVYLIRPDRAHIDPNFLAAWLSQSRVMTSLVVEASPRKLLRVPRSRLAAIEVPLPSVAHQRSIGSLAVCAIEEAFLFQRLASAHARLRTGQITTAIAYGQTNVNELMAR